MHPQLNRDKLKQLQSKEGSKHSLWSSVTGIFSKIKNYIIPSSEDETKFPPPLALRIYLSKYHKILIGKVCTSKSTTEVITDIIYIFNSLYKAYLQIDSSSRSLPNSHDIQKVCILLFICKIYLKGVYFAFDNLYVIMAIISIKR